MRSGPWITRCITEETSHLLLFEDPLASLRMSKRCGISKIVLVKVHVVYCRR